MPTYTNPVLSISVKQSADGTELLVTETTGLYNVVTNPNGWGGGGGAVIGATVQANLYITNLNTGITYTIDVSATLPSSSNDSVSIDYGDLGGTSGDVLPDNVWLIKYGVSDGIIAENQYTNNPTSYILTTYNACCCIKKLYAAISFEDCCGSSDKIKKALEASTWLSAARSAACSGYVDRVTKLLEIVARYCGGSDCGCN